MVNFYFNVVYFIMHALVEILAIKLCLIIFYTYFPAMYYFNVKFFDQDTTRYKTKTAQKVNSLLVQRDEE